MHFLKLQNEMKTVTFEGLAAPSSKIAGAERKEEER